MTNSLYLRPTGFLYGSAADKAVRGGRAIWLAGGPIAFTTVEMVEGEPGATRSTIYSCSELDQSSDSAITEILERIYAPCAPMAGLHFDRPLVMGVINVTPDSFSDGGLHDSTDAAVSHGARLAEEGADILDIGGESTRPGSDPVDAAREAERILPVLAGLKGVDAVLSADTRKPDLMAKAAEAGAAMINDVSALSHADDSIGVAAKTGLPVVLMHAKGDPKTMQDDPHYEDVVLEIYEFLQDRIAACEAAGIARERLIVDPGIGFGKTLEHNLRLLEKLSIFHGLGVPLLVGCSRKRFIGTLTDEPDAQQRGAGSIAAVLAAAAKGAQLHRVHDVRETVRALKVWRASVAGSATQLV